MAFAHLSGYWINIAKKPKVHGGIPQPTTKGKGKK